MRVLIATVLVLVGSSGALANQTGLAGMHEWTKERGRTCMKSHYHSGAGSGPTKRAARRAAIRSWREFTAWEYGTDWASFRRAASRGISYRKTSSGWSASVRARPCVSRRR